MVEVREDGDAVVFEPVGWHKLWALRGAVRVPRASIVAARENPGAAKGFPGIRLPGTHLPGVIVAGSYWWKGAWAFYDVARGESVLEVELDGSGFYRRLVVGVESAAALAGRLSPGAPAAG